MDKLIGEIGGSSSRWAWLKDDQDLIFPSAGAGLPGFNPLTGDAVAFQDGLRQFFISAAPAVFQAKELQIYGAGCGTTDRRERMRQVLLEVWPQAQIEVDTDLMGAAIGLCGDQQGLVLILGTGMNAGYFNGRTLHRPMPSLGYVLGDEGSGADIGRVLLQDAFYRRMPEDLIAALFGADGPALPQIIEEVYRSPSPARQLASRTAMLAQFLDQPYVRNLVSQRFHELAEILATFFDQQQRAEVFATGSVAYGFKETLGECLIEYGMELKMVTKDPLTGLIAHARRTV
jgi:N-acetylglucosamine kinase-like BadF-type ATPase